MDLLVSLHGAPAKDGKKAIVTLFLGNSAFTEYCDLRNLIFMSILKTDMRLFFKCFA